MGEKQKNPTHMPILIKNHHVERAQYVFLGRSKTLCFHDVSKMEILQVTVLRMLTVRKLCFALVYGALEAIPERKFTNS